MNSSQLEAFVATVNERVQDCIDSSEYDRVFLDSLDECMIAESELGECFLTEMGDWYWWTKADGRRIVLLQYSSGRVAAIERS